MAKRSEGFERIPSDLYRTWDERAVRALLPHLSPGTTFVEPCAGHGDLIDQLVLAGHRCLRAYDIDPKRGDIERADALNLTWATKRGFWITNPPWTRPIMHKIIVHLARQAPLWALFDADWMHTDQANQILEIYGRKVVSIGRLRWIPGTPDDAKDNCCWYLFDGTRPPSATEFIARR